MVVKRRVFFPFVIGVMLSGLIWMTPYRAGADDAANNFLTAVAVPSVEYDNNTNIKEKDFIWSYNDRDFAWHVEVPSALLVWDGNFQKQIKGYYSCKYAYQQKLLYHRGDDILRKAIDSCQDDVPDYTAWMKEPGNQAYTSYLAKDLDLTAKTCGYDRYETADFILSFVGAAIPYKLADLPTFPGQTLMAGSDCEGKSILYASVLKKLGYQVCFLVFDPAKANSKQGHVAVGIVFSKDELPQNGNSKVYFSNDGGKTRYYFAETTEKDWHVGNIEKQGDQAHLVVVK